MPESEIRRQRSYWAWVAEVGLAVVVISLTAAAGVRIGRTLDRVTGFGRWEQRWLGKTCGLGAGGDFDKYGNLTDYRRVSTIHGKD